MKGYLLWASALLSAACAQANEWHAYYRLDADAYQQKFDTMVDDGFRLNSVSGYEYNGEANFAAIFEKRESVPWITHNALTYDQFDDKFYEYMEDGYRVIQINGYTVNDVDYYSAIWEKSKVAAWQARIGMSREYMQSYFDKFLEEGYTLTHTSGYERDGQALFSGVWVKNGKTDWFSQGEMTSNDFKTLFDRKVDEGFRLINVDGYQKDGTAYYNAIWDRSDACAWEARVGLDSPSFQEHFDKFREEGYVLRTFNAYNVGEVDRYAGIWVKPY